MFAKVRRCQSGAAAVELGLIAPFLAATIVGMTDLACAYSMKIRLAQAAQRSLEKIQYLDSKADSSSQSAIQTEATTAAADAGYASSTATVTYTHYCNGVATTNYNDPCSGTPTEARYINVSISSNYTPFFTNSYFPNKNNNGTVTITGQAGMRVQ